MSVKTAAKRSMSRNDATDLYQALQGKMRKQPTMREKLRSAVGAGRSAGVSMPKFRIKGNSAALALVVIFSCAKIGLSFLEHSGFASVDNAEATLAPMISKTIPLTQARVPVEQYSKEEVKVLSMLDARRTELEDRGSLLDRKENDLRSKEQELAVRMSELKSLTEKLKADRQQDERKRNNQIDQLSKVYSSMNPEEASGLMEQLDISIALALLQRMPEKRIGQILALMTPERALSLTKMLSGNQ